MINFSYMYNVGDVVRVILEPPKIPTPAKSAGWAKEMECLLGRLVRIIHSYQIEGSSYYSVVDCLTGEDITWTLSNDFISEKISDVPNLGFSPVSPGKILLFLGE